MQLSKPLYSLWRRGSDRGGDGGGGRVTVVGASSGSSMGRTRRVPRIATSFSGRVRSWSRPSSVELLVRFRLTVRDPEASVLTVTSAYIELTLASFRMKSSSSWSWPSFSYACGLVRQRASGPQQEGRVAVRGGPLWVSRGFR